jgi:hypothetical protein
MTRILRRSAALTNAVVVNIGIPCVYLMNRVRYEAVAHPYRVIRINPGAVQNQIRSDPGPRHIPGTIVGGTWDLDVSPFAESKKYQGLVEHYIYSKPWEETVLFNTALSAGLERNGHIMGMRCLRELAIYYEDRIDPLFEEIRSRGFAAPSVIGRVHPVDVLIGREGELLWGMGGNHRLAIAKILQLSSIPARVAIRHTQWQYIRERFKKSGGRGFDARLREHPDLQDLILA